MSFYPMPCDNLICCLVDFENHIQVYAQGMLLRSDKYSTIECPVNSRAFLYPILQSKKLNHTEGIK